MNPALITPPRSGYSRKEEFLNVATAAIGLVAVLAYLPFLLTAARHSSAPHAMAGAIVFSLSLVLLYSASTLYHSLPEGAAKHRVRILDHSAIFVLIAGTYTPLILGPLHGHGGGWLLLLEWTLAAAGILIKILAGWHLHRITDGIYIVMGWAGLLWVRPFIQNISWNGFVWVLAGGVIYTAGIVFYKAKHRPYMHGLWHLFVLVGTACHAWAVLKYAL